MAKKKSDVKKSTRLMLVDTKERNHHDIWFETGDMAAAMPGTLTNAGFIHEFRSMDIGDYHILLGSGFSNGDWLVIESKTWLDLIASARDTGEGRVDSRLRHQLRGLLNMQAEGYQVAILIVGVVTKVGGRQPKGVYVSDKGRRKRVNRMTYAELEGIRAAIQRLGILTYQAPTEFEVPHSLELLANLCERDEHFEPPGLPAVAGLVSNMSFLATQLTGVHGIGNKLAIAIAVRYHTFTQFWDDATVEDLTEVPGIGKPTAQTIYTAFHGYTEGETPQIGDIEWSS